jgi:hypothetical protein
MRKVALRRLVFALLFGAALSAPFLLVARAGDALLAPLTEASVAALLRLTARLPVTPEKPAPALELVFDAPTELALERTPKRSGRAPKSVAKAPSLFVSRATVLKLSQSAARPSGSFVSATPGHPAGLLLGGVAALGIGLQDGDILIEAMGIVPRAPAEIVGAVIEARSRRVEALSGTLWRRGQSFRITVQQPY